MGGRAHRTRGRYTDLGTAVEGTPGAEGEGAGTDVGLGRGAQTQRQEPTGRSHDPDR